MAQAIVRVPQLSLGMNTRQLVGIDTRSGVTATTEVEDFLEIDTAPTSAMGIELGGVGGGIAKAAGRGIAVFPARVADGSTILVFDEAVLIRKSRPGDSSVHILSSTRLRKGGLRSVQLFDEPGALSNVPGVLECKYTKRTYPLVEKSGIMLLETVKKRASNYKNNRELHAAIEMYRQGRGPPYLPLHPRTYTPGNFR